MADRLWICGEDSLLRDTFSVGETLCVAGRGLPSHASLAFTLRDGRGKRQLVARLASDRHGSLPVTVLLPHFGLMPHPDERRWLTHQAARNELGGQAFHFDVEANGNGLRLEHSLPFSVARKDEHACVFPSDADGRIRTGIVHGEAEIGVTLLGFAPGCVRIWAVARQFGWRIGDPIEPIRDRAGNPVMRSVRADAPRAIYVRLAGPGDLGPGSYQFIARAYRPGWFEADQPVLLKGDVVSDRRIASLVVRIPLKDLGYENGVILTPRIAGRPLAHRPYFTFLQNFPLGTDVYAALDPDALPTGLVSTRAAIYVIAHKTAAQWQADNTLVDISGPNMTAAAKIVPIVPGCVNWNSTLVWSNPQVPGQYDIVIDFGNNAADPSQFVPTGTLIPPLDMIDGYIRVGFYVTQDPSLPGAFAGAVGQHDYALPAIDVPSTDAGPTPTDSLPLTATIRYPAQVSGIDAPFAAGAFPLIVVMHGNSGMETSYLGYNYLLDHLASWGFVAMSIYAPVGVFIETRARAILAHLGIMAQENANPGLFQGHIDFAHLGIIGHSRGAEAVVRAARINAHEALGWNILAGISIAPTDYFHYGDPGIPLLVIYGANDGDVSGAWPDRTGFNIYDESGRPRSHAFVYGATHDRFNSEWASIEATTELTWDIAPSDVPKLISLTDHENVAKGYVTAFFQAHLLGHDEQLEYFNSGLSPSLTSSLQIHVSHQTSGTRVLDDFAQGNPAVNSLGGAVVATSLSTFAENQLRTLDGHSPHVVAGGDIAWASSAGVYLSNVPATAKDLSGFNTLSFRVAQKYESAKNPLGQAQDLHVRIADSGGKSRAIRVSVFTAIPFPYLRGYDDLVKSALKSVRIPLASYVIANLGAQDVDLAKVSAISFEFDATAGGELDIGDIEFAV